MANVAGREILFSDFRGLSIPWCFATEILEGHVVEGLEDFQRLKSLCERHDKWQYAEEEEGYWGAWHDVLLNVAVRDNEGHVYRLDQDGDVFLVPHEKYTQWVSYAEEDGDAKIPGSFSEYSDDPDEYEGHFEWKKGNASFDVNVCEEKH